VASTNNVADTAALPSNNGFSFSAWTLFPSAKVHSVSYSEKSILLREVYKLETTTISIISKLLVAIRIQGTISSTKGRW
jgi:hypothetical protein